MRLGELESYLKDFLKVGDFDDEALNGLQVEGKPEIRKVAVAVSACQEVFLAAESWGADALVLHHGLFWKSKCCEPVRGIFRERLSLLLKAKISLFAFHLPLDAHPAVGNNAVAASGLGLCKLQPFGEYHGMKIGFRGRFPEPVTREVFVDRLETYYGRKALVVLSGPDTIVDVGLVSGGAAREAEQAEKEGLDFYVTGEPGEPVTYLCREAGLNFAALGHYATERVGVRALGAHLAEKFGLETKFLDVENDY